MMDGYEYEAKVLWPMWNKDSAEQLARVKARSASSSSSNGGGMDSVTKERLKSELGIEMKENAVDVELELSNKMFRNTDSSSGNFIPELSPNNEIWDLGRRFRNHRR